MNKVNLFIGYLFWAVLPLALTAQDLTTTIDAYMREHIDLNGPGCSVGVVFEGRTVLKQSYGLANIEHKIPFSAATVSDIGSVAKQMTCMAIQMLAFEGKLSTSDPIQLYLSDLPAYTEPITIAHLMHHTSGLREIYASMALAGNRANDFIAQEDGLKLVRTMQSLNFPAGSQYAYCNTAYQLLAEIVKQVSGKSFETFMQERLFQPLGMDFTYIMDQQGEVFSNAAVSYQKKEDGTYVNVFDNSTLQGAGGVYTTLNDLIIWMRQYRLLREVNPALWREMTTPGTLTDGSSLNYACGLQVNSLRGERNIRHSGSSAGFRSFVIYFMDRDLIITLKSNYGELNLNDVAELIYDHYGITESVNPSPVASSAEAVKEETNLTQYLGNYFCPELKTYYEVSQENGQLYAFHIKHGLIPLTAQGNGEFSSDQWFLSQIRFETQGDKVTGFKVDNGRVQNLWFEKESS